MKEWSNLAKVVARRTYSRKDNGYLENWPQTIDRALYGNVKGFELDEEEINSLKKFGYERKAFVAGRGLWFSGSPSHNKLGGVALNNCWFLTIDDIRNFVITMDLLMLGGGVGASVEHKFVSKLPRVKRNVKIEHKATKDADFIVPDSREGWEHLFERVLEAFFVTGKGFTYSTVCIRGYGEDIKGFGGTASGPIPLIKFVENISRILTEREGRHIRPIDASDMVCCTGEMVVAGNVRRSAIIILGDPFDKEYLTAKRWDLDQIPSYRAFANLSVVCEDIEDLHPLFWKTYEHGEPFGLVNRKNIQTFGRMGERKRDTAIGTNPCGEATLEPFEPCNLQEIFLPNLESIEEFEQAAVLMHRWGKRVTCEKYHIEEVDRVVKRNRRIGTSITGCLQSPKLFTPDILDRVYGRIGIENVEYSKSLGIPLSIRTTLNKPSGTLSKVGDCDTEGIHAAWSRAMIQRVRFAANDPLIPMLREAGHPMEPMKNLDGTIDFGTMVVDFYKLHSPETPCMDEGFDTWKQLDVLLMAQKWWADQAVSVTVTYKKEEILQVKEWLQNNFKYLKTISFLAYSDHGFEQAPKERITEEQYWKLNKKIKPLDIDLIPDGDLESMECQTGMCPIK